MKLQSPLRIIVAAALLTLLGAACATMTSGPAALAGTWTNSLGTVWTINADGTFHVMSIKPKRKSGATIRSQAIPSQFKKRGYGRGRANLAKDPACISSAAQTEILCPSFWSVTLASRGSKT